MDRSIRTTSIVHLEDSSLYDHKNKHKYKMKFVHRKKECSDYFSVLPAKDFLSQNLLE